MDHVISVELQLHQRVRRHDERRHLGGEAALLMHHHAVQVVVVPAELMAADLDRHLLIADRLEVLLQLDEAVGRDRQHDDEGSDRPADLEPRMTVDLRWHVAGGLAGATVAKNYPQEGSLDPDEHDDRDHRDADVGVVDALSIGRDRVGEDRAQAADIAGAEDESEGGQADGREERASASCHETKVYRRSVWRPGVPDRLTGWNPKAIEAVAHNP